MSGRRLYLDEARTVFCVLDAEDFDWASRWKWRFTLDRHGRKAYATRNTRRGGKQIKIYLHKAILAERMKAVPPSRRHTIGDHQDGDSLNNRRSNLRWFTPAQNRATARPAANPYAHGSTQSKLHGVRFNRPAAKPQPDDCGLCGQSWWCCGETMCPQPRQPAAAQAFPELQPERQAALNASYQSLMESFA